MCQLWRQLSIAFLCPFLSFDSLQFMQHEDAFFIETKRDSDRVEVKTDRDASVITVRSPSGIGQAIIQRKDDQWPKKMEVRLYLKGLENLQISNSQTTLNAAASVHAGELIVRVWQDGNEDCPLTPSSKYWPGISVSGMDNPSDATIPLRGGYFVVSIPPALMVSNPKSITLKWIDFYRN